MLPSDWISQDNGRTRAASNGVEIIPAVLPTDRDAFFALADSVRPFAQTVQIDIMDGVFAQGLSWPLRIEDFDGLRLPYADEIFWEVHLMVKEPRALGELFIHAGAKRVIAHIEAFENADAARTVFDVWHGLGAQVGASLLLQTPISAMEEIAHDVEVVLVMGIEEIGAQGHPFEPRTVARVRELRNHFPHTTIAVDGGVNMQNAPELASAGANRLCVGSAIMNTSDPRAAYDAMVQVVAKIS